MKYDARKRQIMDAGLSLFARNGYHSTSVADVVNEIDVARGTFYRYFEDKHDLFDQLLETNFKYIKAVLARTPANVLAEASSLESMLEKTFVALFNQPNSKYFVEMMVCEAARADIVFARKIEAFYDDLALLFSQNIEKLQKQGLIEKRNPKVLAYVILGALKEIFVQWTSGGKFDDLRSLIRETAASIVYGIRPSNISG